MEPPIRSPALPSPMGWVSGGLSCWPCREKHWVGCEAVLLGVGMCHLPCVTALRHWHCPAAACCVSGESCTGPRRSCSSFFLLLFVLFCFVCIVLLLSFHFLQTVWTRFATNSAWNLQKSSSHAASVHFHPLCTRLWLHSPAWHSYAYELPGPASPLQRDLDWFHSLAAPLHLPWGFVMLSWSVVCNELHQGSAVCRGTEEGWVGAALKPIPLTGSHCSDTTRPVAFSLTNMNPMDLLWCNYASCIKPMLPLSVAASIIKLNVLLMMSS